MDLPAAMARVAEVVEAELDALLPRPEGAEARLADAMRYATLGGGKRLRAFLVMESRRPVRRLRDLRGARGSLDRDAACLFAGPRRPAGDGRRRPAPRQALRAQGSSTRPPRSWPATRCRRAPSRCWREPDTHSDPRCALRAGGGAGQGGRRARHGRRPDDRHAGRGPGRLSTGRQSPGCSALKTGALIEFAAEAGAILGRAPRAEAHLLCRPTRTIWARRSRSPTICWTRKAARRRPARPPARMPPPARRRWSRCWGSSGRERRLRLLARSGSRASGSLRRARGAAAGTGVDMSCTRRELNFGARDAIMTSREHAAAGHASAIRRTCATSRPEQLRQLADELRAGDDRRGVGDRRPSRRRRWAWWS